MSAKVLGIGAALIDTLIFVEDSFLSHHNIAKGSVSRVSKVQLEAILNEAGDNYIDTPGGSCANTLRALAKLGHACTLTGKIMLDPPGKILLEDLKRRGIAAYYYPCNVPTGRVLCLITPDGERTMCDFLGASEQMSGSDLDPQIFEGQFLTHVEGYSLFNHELTNTAFKYAKKANTQISFDLANFKIVELYRPWLLENIKNCIDVVFCNHQEAETLLNMQPEEACYTLSKQTQMAIVTIGAKGSLIGVEGKLTFIESHKVEKVVDTTGAGDMYAAGILNGYLRGYSPEKSGRQAAFLAAQVLGQRGALIQDSILEEIVQYDR